MMMMIRKSSPLLCSTLRQSVLAQKNTFPYEVDVVE